MVAILKLDFGSFVLFECFLKDFCMTKNNGSFKEKKKLFNLHSRIGFVVLSMHFFHKTKKFEKSQPVLEIKCSHCCTKQARWQSVCHLGVRNALV